MKKDMMWAFMIYLGSNMWSKKGEKRPYRTEWEEEFHEEMVTSKEVWRKVTDFLPECGINTLLIDIGEGVQFDSHPELAIPGSWTKAELKAEIDRLRSIGVEPIPKLNFSCGHNGWLGDYAQMVGTDTYYQVCEDLIIEMIELFDTPEFFHLGLDEERIENQPYYPFAVVRAPYQQMEDALKLFKICLDRGVRPWMWIDAHAVESFGGEEEFCKKVPKEVLISNWYYDGIFQNAHKEKIQLYNKLGEWGYEQAPTSSTWGKKITNSRETMRYCKETVKEESIRGYMTAAWLYTDEESYYGLLNDAYRFGCAKKTIYGEE